MWKSYLSSQIIFGYAQITFEWMNCSCRRSRESGVHEEVDLEKEEGIFDYVDDREYAKIVQQRQEEGFVLDDSEKWAKGNY